MALLQDFRCRHRLRVRWAEVDMQQVAFNAHYLNWADCAVGEYWRALGLPYAAAMQQLGGELFLRHSSIDYLAPARLDDWLDLGVACTDQGESSLGFEVLLGSGNRSLARMALRYVFADPQAQAKRSLPPALRATIAHYEAGGEMLELRLGTWTDLGADATRLRMAVFVQEQGIAPELEIDALDAQCLHAVAYNRLGLPVATGRLLSAEADGSSRIGRMAVDRALRGQQCGRLVLDALLQAAQARGDCSVLLHAQCSAEGFYRRAGFVPEGERFDEVEIPHIAMRLRW
ncbi:MAG: GNAT family N-acetyltransferase [Comamonadaceae bacterium]|jgi:YbgC/YbaW family acyl-CoA thioester hydrolase|nr:GNAT family N-acetyltransferase [Comamonadaceae bacterium]